jgi:hypothetical protein
MNDKDHHFEPKDLSQYDVAEAAAGGELHERFG